VTSQQYRKKIAGNLFGRKKRAKEASYRGKIETNYKVSIPFSMRNLFFSVLKKRKPHPSGHILLLKNNGNQPPIEHNGGVSGDKKHPLALNVYQGIPILSPSKFLRMV